MSTPDDIEGYVAGLKVTELREELKKLNQPHHGNKAALGQRLRETLERRKAEGDQEEQKEETETTAEETETTTGEEASAQGGECEAAESNEAPAEAEVAEEASEKMDEVTAETEKNGDEVTGGEVTGGEVTGGEVTGDEVTGGDVEVEEEQKEEEEQKVEEDVPTEQQEEELSVVEEVGEGTIENQQLQQEVPEEKAEEQTTETEGGVQEETKDEAMDTAAAESAAAPASSEGGDKAEENNEVGKEERKRPREDDDHGRRRDRDRRDRPDPTKAPDPEDPSEDFSEESVSTLVQTDDQFEAPEDEATITLDTFNSDLYFKIGPDGLTGRGLSQQGFSQLWAAAKATWGAKGGKVFYEIKVVEHVTVDLPESEEHPNALRVGWSVGESGLGLGEAPLSYGFGSTGKGVVNNQYNEYGEAYGVDDVITCLLDMESSPPSISFARNGNHLGMAFTLDEEKVKGRVFFPHVTTKNVVVKLNFTEPLLQPLPEGFEEYLPLQTASTEHKEKAVAGPKSNSECEVIMMVGLPASGKTTWAEKHMRENPEKHYTILGTNQIMDKMKVSGLMRRGNYHGRWEVLIKKATDILNRLLVMAGKNPRNYIIDQTNVYAKAQYRKMGYFQGFVRKAVVVIPPHHELRKRTAMRTKEMGDPVPEDALNAMRANFHVPAKDNVFDDVLFTEIYGQAANKIIQQYKDDALGLPSYPQNKRGRYDRYDRPPGGPSGRFGPPRGSPYGSPSYRGSYGSGPGYGRGGYPGPPPGGYGGYRPMYPPYGAPSMYGPPPPRRGNFGYGPPGPSYGGGGGRSPYGYGPPPPRGGPYYGRY
jgi:heterogeneous nuclear ribonucleoprotein U-like protein 1